MTLQLGLIDSEDIGSPPRGSIAELAERFCNSAPHRFEPYSRRNWGGTLHSLCSYQGKLKPAIAHFLVEWFTKRGDVVLDPMAGVGTIPLEARRLGRIGLAGDLSPLAISVSRAKLEVFRKEDVAAEQAALEQAITSGPPLEDLVQRVDVAFGLNGPISEYFHPDTLRELLIARQHFLGARELSTAAEVIRSSLLHLLHGNRPYALSRCSHPVTPFAPTGPTTYRSVVGHLEARLNKVVPELLELASSSLPGTASLSDFRNLDARDVDAVITSPPFAKSLRFWSSNWMRLWFAGWNPDDFGSEPARFLETEQKTSFEPYRAFADHMHRMLKPNGLLIMHLGETANANMVELVVPMVQHAFEVVHVGRENVEDTESHGLRDKGATVAHWYLFATRR